MPRPSVCQAALRALIARQGPELDVGQRRELLVEDGPYVGPAQTAQTGTDPRQRQAGHRELAGRVRRLADPLESGGAAADTALGSQVDDQAIRCLVHENAARLQ